MKTIRASEIGEFAYCRRAWWYHAQGYEPSNQPDLAEGTEMHYRHARTIMLSSCLRLLAYIVLLGALLILAGYLASSLI